MFWRKKREKPEPKKIEQELKRRRKHFTKEEREKVKEMLEKNMSVKGKYETAGEASTPNRYDANS